MNKLAHLMNQSSRIDTIKTKGMDGIKKQVLEVLHNLNWLLEPHNSFVELVKIKGNKVIVRSAGSCNKCESDCIGVAFKERLPDVELVRR